MRLKDNAPARSVTEVGPGDFIKLASGWKRIHDNSAHGAEATPRSWVIQTEDNSHYVMWDIFRYAKAEDLEVGG